VEPLTVAGSNTSAFLTAVLKSKQTKKGEPSYILARGINTKNTATLVQSSMPLLVHHYNYKPFPTHQSIEGG
jgi:hypothetical protein